jgi:hypothetical protein
MPKNDFNTDYRTQCNYMYYLSSQVLLHLQEGSVRQAVRVRVPVRAHLPCADAHKDTRTARDTKAVREKGHSGKIKGKFS